MSYSFLQSPKSNSELLKAWTWYEEESRGLGDRFIIEVHKKINTICKNPLHYPLKGKFREVKIETFPFLIVFDIVEQNKQISIISIFHMSRNSKRKYLR